MVLILLMTLYRSFRQYTPHFFIFSNLTCLIFSHRYSITKKRNHIYGTVYSSLICKLIIFIYLKFLFIFLSIKSLAFLISFSLIFGIFLILIKNFFCLIKKSLKNPLIYFKLFLEFYPIFRFFFFSYCFINFSLGIYFLIKSYLLFFLFIFSMLFLILIFLSLCGFLLKYHLLFIYVFVFLLMRFFLFYGFHLWLDYYSLDFNLINIWNFEEIPVCQMRPGKLSLKDNEIIPRTPYSSKVLEKQFDHINKTLLPSLKTKFIEQKIVPFETIIRNFFSNSKILHISFISDLSELKEKNFYNYHLPGSYVEDAFFPNTLDVSPNKGRDFNFVETIGITQYNIEKILLERYLRDIGFDGKIYRSKKPGSDWLTINKSGKIEYYDIHCPSKNSDLRNLHFKLKENQEKNRKITILCGNMTDDFSNLTSPGVIGLNNKNIKELFKPYFPESVFQEMNKEPKKVGSFCLDTDDFGYTTNIKHLKEIIKGNESKS